MQKKFYVGISTLVVLALVIFDQLTKWLIVKSMSIGDSYEVIPGF